MAEPRIFLSPPHVFGRERDLMLDAFDSNWIAPLGPHVDAFEREVAALVGVTSAAALASGTSALHLALIALGVGSGDRVICSSFTFAASANPIVYAGAEPLFVDSEADTWNLDPLLLEEALKTSRNGGVRVGAVIAVDLYGNPCRYDEIERLCKQYEVPLIEDAAEALGSFYRGQAAGSFGDIGVLSFNGNKIITSSGGGMLVADDEKFVERIRFLATQARDAAPHYQHSEIGYNYRMSNILAAIGRGQLETLDQRVARRREIFERYRTELGAFDGISFAPETANAAANRWLSCIIVDEARFGCSREAIRLTLESQNIESRPLWKPMHLQPVFERFRMIGGSVSEQLFRDGLCLPSGSSLTNGDQERVIRAIIAARQHIE